MSAPARGDARLGVSSAPLKGIALVIGGGAAFTLNDSAMKWLRADYPVGELVTVRGVFSIVVVLLLIRFIGGWQTLRVRDWRGQLMRASLVLITTVCFVGALRYMPLADAMGIAFAGPLFTVALAGPLLGERVGWRRWSAVMVGFCGLLLMVRPTGAGFQLAAILPLIVAFCGALRDIVTRRMSLTDHSNATLACGITIVVLVGSLSLPLGAAVSSQAWILPTPAHLVLFALCGVLLGIGQYCLIEALRVAQVGVIAPFKYINYLWGLLLGFVLWRDVPSASSLVGAMIVIGSGLFIFWREQRLAAIENRTGAGSAAAALEAPVDPPPPVALRDGRTERA